MSNKYQHGSEFNINRYTNKIINKENFHNTFLMKTTHQKLKFQKMGRNFFAVNFFFIHTFFLRLREKFFDCFETPKNILSDKRFVN